LTAEEVFRRYEATQSPRRRRGRPPKAQQLPEGSEDIQPTDE
jgi:hypothetical protein